MDVEKTRTYYDGLSLSDLRECAYCRNYMQEIAPVYPRLTDDLQTIGVDIRKPFETMPLEPGTDGMIEYLAAQYIVFGDKTDFQKKNCDGVTVDFAISHPTTDITDKHFVIEISPIVLPWRNGRGPTVCP